MGLGLRSDDDMLRKMITGAMGIPGISPIAASGRKAQFKNYLPLASSRARMTPEEVENASK
jgi:hypothetical protein